MLRGMHQYIIKKTFAKNIEPMVILGKKELSGQKISLTTQDIPQVPWINKQTLIAEQQLLKQYIKKSIHKKVVALCKSKTYLNGSTVGPPRKPYRRQFLKLMRKLTGLMVDDYIRSYDMMRWIQSMGDINVDIRIQMRWMGWQSLIIQMKGTEKKKKQKVPLNKVTSLGSIKKPELKKTPIPKKQQLSMPIKSYHSVNNSKGTTSSNANIQPSKVGQQSLRTSPKASLGEIRTLITKKNPIDSKRIFEGKKTPLEKKEIEECEIVKEQVKKSLANVIKVYYPEKKPYLDVSMTEATTDGVKKQEKILRSDFNFISVIGEGGYGKVWKVQHNKTRVSYAMKQMSKALIVIKKSVDNVLNEMKILSKLKNIFIANMVCAFNDRDNLYLIMDYLAGGDLRNYLADSDQLSEDQVKFIIACIIKSLQYLHTNKIFHRDIKPQNLVLDSKGYIRLTDFGIARSAKDKQPLDASGTPGYMAPQVICKQLHSFSVDFYAVGIICHELMLGKRPYYGQNRQEIRDAILSKQHSIKKKQLPSGWSPDCADFINKLIQRQPANRLGGKSGVKELIEHGWLKKYPWKQLCERKIISPLQKKTNVTSNTEKLNDYDEAVNQFKILERTEQKKDIFGEYFCQFRQ